MVWYNPLILLAFVAGILFIVFGSYNSKKWVWGVILILVAIVAKLLIWIGGNL